MLARIKDFVSRRHWQTHPRLEIHLADTLRGGAGSYVKIDGHDIPTTKISVEYEAGGVPFVTFTTIARYLDFKLMDDLRDIGVEIKAVELVVPHSTEEE